MAKRRLTRRELLVVIARLQSLCGEAMMGYGNDRDPNGFEKGQTALKVLHALCIDAAGRDPIVTFEELAKIEAVTGRR